MAWPFLVISGFAAYLLRDKTIEKARSAVQSWEPEDDWEREIDYRADLADYLREELPETFVVEEYGDGRSRKDLRIESKESERSVVIELKYNLKTSNEANRLLGQAVRYKDNADAIIIILIGCDPNQVAEIEKHLFKNNDDGAIELMTLEFDESND